MKFALDFGSTKKSCRWHKRISVLKSFQDFQARQGWHLCRNEMKKSQAPSGAKYAAPDGIENLLDAVLYKDAASTALGMDRRWPSAKTLIRFGFGPTKSER